MKGQIFFEPGLSFLTYNISQKKGKNIFDQRGPYRHWGNHVSVGYHVSPKSSFGVKVHYFYPTEKKEQGSVISLPPSAPQQLEVNYVESTRAITAMLFYKGYVAGNYLDSLSRFFIRIGCGYSSFVRKNQFEEYDETQFSPSIPIEQEQILIPIHIGLGIEFMTSVAGLFIEPAFSGDLRKGNAQYLRVDAGIWIPLNVSGRKNAIF